jgi:hypothetical protein
MPQDLLKLRTRETRKAREDAMPHERCSTPVLPFEFDVTALADRQIRFRREFPCCQTFVNGPLPDRKVNR